MRAVSEMAKLLKRQKCSQQQHFYTRPWVLEGTCEEGVRRAFLFLAEFVCAVQMFSWCLANI